MLKVTLRNLFANKLRLLLTGFAIVLGVSFVSGTFMFTDTLGKSFENLFAEINKGVDIVVSDSKTPNPNTFADNVKPLPASYLDVVKNTPGVKHAVGDILSKATMLKKDGKTPIKNSPNAPNLGSAWINDPDLGSFHIKTGHSPQNPNEFVTDASAAKNGDLKLGDLVEIKFNNNQGTFKLVGTAKFGKSENAAGATMALFELNTAQKLMGYEGKYTAIEAKVKDVSTLDETIDKINEQLPAPYKAISGADQAKKSTAEIKKQLGFFTTFLLVFSGIAVFVSAYIIANTFSILIAQRSRDLALLRALGASRKQILRSVMGESIIIGALASVLGLFGGIALAYGLRALLEAFGASFPSTPLQFETRTAVVGFLVGFTATVLSAIIPARRASHIPPVAALRDNTVETTLSRKRRLSSATVLLIFAAIFLWFGLFGHVGPKLAFLGIGALLAFFTVTSVAPMVVKPLTDAIRAVLRLPLVVLSFGRYKKTKFFGSRSFISDLAKLNTQRNPRRTAITASALMIGVGLVTSVIVLVGSAKASVAKILSDNLTADYVVSSNQFQPFSHEVVNEVQKLPSVASVYGMQSSYWSRNDGKEEQVLGADSAALRSVFKMKIPSQQTQAFNSGGVLVDKAKLKNLKLNVGNKLTMKFVNETISVPIVGTYDTKKLPNQSGFIIPRSLYAQAYPDPSDVIVFVNGKPNEQDLTAIQVKKVVDKFPGLAFENQQDFIKTQEKNLDAFLALMTGLLLLAIIIAVLGIVNTLALSVIERTRELGLLRGVGTKRRQLRQMIRNESVNISFVGAILGVIIGIAFGILIVASLHKEGITELRIPIGRILAIVLVSGIAGVLASIFPARRASRIDILKAIEAT
jgi:putative ABC transport system permease protein